MTTREHPSDRAIEKLEHYTLTAYVVRSDHWDEWRSEVWNQDGRIYSRSWATRKAALRDAKQSIVEWSITVPDNKAVSYKIRYEKEYNEYRVMFYDENKRYCPNSDYFTSDKADAKGTAEHIIKNQR